MHTRRIYLFIGIYIVMVFAMGWAAKGLRFDGNLESLLPSENPHVKAYQQLKELRSSEGGMDLVIRLSADRRQALLEQGGDSLVQDELIAQAGRLADYVMNDAARNGGIAFSGVEWKSDLDKLQKHLFYLMTERELDGIYQVIEQAIEEEKQEVNPFYFRLEEDSSAAHEPSPVELIAEYKASSSLLTLIDNAHPYEWNVEEGSILLRFLLPFRQSDFELLGQTYTRAMALAKSYEADHPEVQLFWGGSYVDHFFRIEGIWEAVGDALWIGLLTLLVFLWLYMRKVGREGVLGTKDLALDMALMIGLLLAGVVLTLGLYSFLQAQLNLFSAIIFSVLMGMNLDYLLHMYALIRRGEPLSWRQTAPIRYSALTTTLAIASLMFAELDGFVQLGMIVAINVPIHLGSCYLWLPLSAAARKGASGFGVDSNANVGGSLGRDAGARPDSWVAMIGNRLGKASKVMNLTYGGVLLTVVLLAGAYAGLEHVEFNTDFTSLEPVTRTPDYREAARKIPEPNRLHLPSFLLAPSPESAKQFFQELQERLHASDRGNDLAYVDQVESLSGRMPSGGAEEMLKMEKVEKLQALIRNNEEYLGGLDDELQRYAGWALEAEIPKEDDLPDYLRNRFSLRSGELAPLILVYPNRSLSSGTRSMEYLQHSGILYSDEGTPYVLASTQLIAASVFERLMADTRWVTIAPFLALFLVIFGIYRRFSWSVLALAPLVGTFLVLLSWNLLFTVPLHIYNVAVLPIIIGVSVDNGIHLVHAYRAHGKDFFAPFWLRVYPVLVGCSFTTVLGFVGLLFVHHPGMADMGGLAIGAISSSVVLTLLCALVLNSWLHRKAEG